VPDFASQVLWRVELVFHEKALKIVRDHDVSDGSGVSDISWIGVLSHSRPSPCSMGNPGQDERDSGMMPNGIPG